MTKEINPEEASSWDDEETAYNLKYLEDRGRWAEAQEVRDALEAPVKKSRRAAKSDEEDE